MTYHTPSPALEAVMSDPVTTEDDRSPDLWWSPTIGVWRRTPRGPMLTPGFEMVNDPDGEHFRETLPDDAVQLVPDRDITDLEQELYNRAVAAENALARFKPPEPRVWFPGDDLPYDPDGYVGVAAIGQDGSVLVSPHHVRTVDGPVVELIEPSSEQWQTAVDRARAEREES